MIDSSSMTAGSPALFGMETEYAYSARSNHGGRAELRSDGGELFLRTAMSMLPHLPGSNDDLFLVNGSRLYVDLGHPELATPECTNPWQAVRYSLAGDRIMGRIATHLAAGESQPIEGWLSKCNVDYSGAKTTWACHQSFLYRCRQSDLFKQLIPHLVSRIVFSGAGGWNPFSGGLQFTLSPRTLHLDTVISQDRIPSWGILNTRDESLSSDGNKRLHLQCGDSLESQTSIFLTMGTTALVVALTHAGIATGSAIELADPLAAIRTFALDPTCRLTAPTKRGDLLSAVAIQRHYLVLAEKYAGQKFMPRWTPWVCRLWRKILDRLEENAPWSVADTLDWAIKYALYDRMSHRAVKESSQVLMEFVAAPVESRVRFFEADMRFAQITGNGLFRQLDRAGVLRHRVPGVGDIDRAIGVPPAGSRASVRGRLIQELHASSQIACANWAWVHNERTNQIVDLGEPFCRKAVWKEMPSQSPSVQPNRHEAVERDIEATAVLYRRGHYLEAAGRLDRVNGVIENDAPSHLKIRYWRYRAWITTRRGFVGGMELLDRAPERQQDFIYIYDHLSVARFQGLAIPIATTREWVERAETLIRQDPTQLNNMGVSYLEHKASYLLRCGQVEESLAALRKNVSSFENHPHILGRHTALLGETFRRLGRIDEARRYLTRAVRIQRANHIDGDLADFTLCFRAKLDPKVWRARHWLTVARAIQERLQNHLGLTRTLLLLARLSKDRQEHAQIKSRICEIRAGLTSLNNCEVYQRIWRDWDEWVGDKQSTDEHGDRFWGL